MKQVKATKKHNDLVYDVGMHKGEDTQYYLKKGFRVVGFEANPALVDYCKIKFLKEIKNGKLKIIEGAIVELPLEHKEDMEVTFYRNNDKSVWGTISADWAHRNELLGTCNTIIKVPVINFSRCIDKCGIPYYLKIDIEGMDTICLKALMNFEQKPDYVSIESEKASFEKLLEEFNLFTQLGYTRFKVIQQGSVSRQIEPNPSKEGCYVGYQFQEGSSGLFGQDLPYEWKDYNKTINEYRYIFSQYNLFGEHGKLKNCLARRVITEILSVILRKPVPGWYDTHARHSTVLS